jgi:hypothetical protein
LDEAALKKYPILANPPPKKQEPYYANFTIPTRLQGHLKIDPLTGPGWDGVLGDVNVDWLKDDGKALSEYMEADPAVVRKMKDVLNAFGGAEIKAKAAIEKHIG